MTDKIIDSVLNFFGFLIMIAGLIFIVHVFNVIDIAKVTLKEYSSLSGFWVFMFVRVCPICFILVLVYLAPKFIEWLHKVTIEKINRS